jgi:translation initiation factor IF-3
MTNYNRRKRTPPKDRAPKFAINEQIRAEEVRILDENNEMLGIFSRKEMFALADERGIDVVEVNPKSNPPVVKFVDYNKFKYQMQKAAAKQDVKTDDLKQIRISVRISTHDMQVQTRKIDAFLEKGIKVRIRVQMKRREKQYPEVAEETLHAFLTFVTKPYEQLTDPKLAGDSFVVTIKSK